MYQTIFLILFMGIVIMVQAAPHNETIEAKFRFSDGEKAQPGEFPYIVSIEETPRVVEGHLCTGIIIHPQWILSEPHCLSIRGHGVDLAVRAGTHIANTWQPVPDVQVVNVETRYEHQKDGRHSIALLKLEKELELNEKVQAIALPVADSRPKPTERLMIVRWGIYCVCMRRVRRNLRKQNINLIDPEECEIGGYKHCCINSLCTPCKYSYNCMGDAGAPMLNEQHELIGMILWGEMCCRDRESPEVYVPVSRFVDWIKSRVPLKPTKPSSSSKHYLAHLLIPLPICSLFGILKFTFYRAE